MSDEKESLQDSIDKLLKILVQEKIERLIEWLLYGTSAQVAI